MNIRALTAGLVAAGITVAGCGSGQPDVGHAPPGNTLRVGLLEWRIVTSSTALTPGMDRLTVTNTGTTDHNLYVIGPGVHAHTADLPPGHSATLTLTTRPGTRLALTCELPGHEAAGMHTTVTVTGAVRSDLPTPLRPVP